MRAQTAALSIQAATTITMFLMFWATLVIIGSFFRGEGFNFILPWRQGVHEIFDL